MPYLFTARARPGDGKPAIIGTLVLASTLFAGGCGERPAPEAVEAAAPVATMMHVDAIGMEGGRGLFIAKRDGGETRIAFDVPLDRVAPQRRHDMEHVGETRDGVVVVIDRYATRDPAGGRCADGREAFVRVFSLPAGRQLMERPVESCRDRLAAVEPAVTWIDDAGFRVEGSTPRRYEIRGTDGVVPSGGGPRDGG